MRCVCVANNVIDWLIVRSQPRIAEVNNKIPWKSESYTEPYWKGCKCDALDLEAARDVAPVVTGFNYEARDSIVCIEIVHTKTIDHCS